MPDRHPGDALLAAYAAGTAGEALSLLVAAHATLCPACRRALEAAEAVGGALLDAAPPAEVPGDLLAATLRRLEEPPPPAPVVERDEAGILPAPLVPYARAASFRRVPGGIRIADLSVRLAHTPVRLVDFPPGLRVPTHAHRGVERILVLSGGFTDDVGHFARGDVSEREDPDTLHVQRIDDDGRCLALVFAEGPLRPRSAWGRFLQWWTGV